MPRHKTRLPKEPTKPIKGRVSRLLCVRRTRLSNPPRLGTNVKSNWMTTSPEYVKRQETRIQRTPVIQNPPKSSSRHLFKTRMSRQTMTRSLRPYTLRHLSTRQNRISKLEKQTWTPVQFPSCIRTPAQTMLKVHHPIQKLPNNSTTLCTNCGRHMCRPRIFLLQAIGEKSIAGWTPRINVN